MATAVEAPAVAMTGDGAFVVAFTQVGRDGAGKGVFARRFDPQTNPVGLGFQVNETAMNDQTAPAVACDAAGNFVVAWQSANQDGSSWGIYARRFASTGQSLGGEFPVNHFSA